MRALFVTACILALSGSAIARERTDMSDSKVADTARLSEALKGLSPGKEQGCINLGPGPRQLSSQVIGNVILYKSSRNLIYRNDTAGGCEHGATGHALISVNPGGQLCSGQIIVTRDIRAGFDSGSCALGRFTPYSAKR